MYTVVFHFLPLSTFRKFRYIWAWLLVEDTAQKATSLIDNRNKLETLASHNVWAFFFFWYLESNAMLTPAMLEGLWFKDLTLNDLPWTCYDMAFNPVCSFPTAYVL